MLTGTAVNPYRLVSWALLNSTETVTTVDLPSIPVRSHCRATRFLFLVLALPLVLPLYAHAQSQRAERAIIFPGGSFQIAIFLGMLEAAEEAGKAPDVVVGTCGGAIAAAIAHLIPTSAERKAFIESEEFVDRLRTIRLKQTSLFHVIGMLYRMWATHLPGNDRAPDLFKDTLLSAPRDFGLEKLTGPFRGSGIRAVIVSGRLLYGPEEVGKDREERKLFQEVFFTDVATAELLRGLPSFIAASFPDSSLLPLTDVILEVTPMIAARAGVADPHYLAPISINGHYYMTGAIDLYPLEVGKQLAHSVMMPFSDGFDTIVEQNATFSAYRYDNNERLRRVTQDYADHWVDISDQGEIYARYGFNPRVSYKRFTLVSGLPEQHSEYVSRMRALWEYGKERMREALQTPENGKEHIRNMNSRNTFFELRRALGRNAAERRGNANVEAP
jgi:patatin-like phospholipase